MELMSRFRDGDLIDFGEVPCAVNDILQQGVSLYRHDRGAADARFRDALALDPTALATYFCLYKIHTYQGHIDEALAVAHGGLAEAARQAGLGGDWTAWRSEQLADVAGPPARFALYTLKALAFIHLRRGEIAACEACLAKLAELGQMDLVGGSVVADLARAIA